MLISQVSHDLDVFCWLSGRPSRVSALLRTNLHDVKTEDVAAAVVEFEGGALGSLQASMIGPEIANTRQFVGNKGVILMKELVSLTHDANEEVLLGEFDQPTDEALESLKESHGQPDVRWEKFSWPETPRPIQRLMRPSRLWSKMGLPRRSPPWHAGHLQLLESLVTAIRNGSEPIATGEDAATAAELRNAMVVSAVTGRTVELPVDPDEVDDIYDGLSAGTYSIRGRRR